MKDKRGRKLTRKQKILLADAAPTLNTDNWLCIEDTSDNPKEVQPYIVIKNKTTATVRRYSY